MKFSFFMMPLHTPDENPSLAFQRDIELIEYADALGFDEFFIGEHHAGGWENMPCPEMALAMAAVRAPRIRLGTSVVSLPFHHPFHVAERAAFLDHLTRGRAILGVGPSSLKPDIRLFNIPLDELRPMMAEAVEVIVKLLESAGPIDHDGRFWKFREMRLQLRSYQRPRLPLAIATGGSRGALELAGRYGMILLSGNRRAGQGHLPLADQWAVVEEAARRAGAAAARENWRVVTYVYLAETRERAWAEVEESIRRDIHYFVNIGGKAVYEEYPGQPASEITPQSAARVRNWVIGTPEDAIALIERLRRETGGFGGLMLTTHEWTGTEKLRRSLELFARHVMPHFRGHTSDLKDEWARLQKRCAADELPQPGRPARETPGGLRSNLFLYKDGAGEGAEAPARGE